MKLRPNSLARRPERFRSAACLLASSPAVDTLPGRFENGFGYDGNRSFALLPGFRLFFTGGHFAVTTFFVISGYVLSLKPLQLLHVGDHLQLGDHLASALFRRWLRLYIPLVAILFLTMTTTRIFGIWNSQLSNVEHITESNAWRFYVRISRTSVRFLTKRKSSSATATTLVDPVEFRGSMAVFTSLFALSRSSNQCSSVVRGKP